MQSIPAPSGKSTAGTNSTLPATQKRPVETREPVSAPHMNSDLIRAKSLFTPDETFQLMVERAEAQPNADVDLVQQNKPYHKRGAHWYVAECYSPAGEKMYVGMELIDEKNLAALQLYAGGARSLIRGVATIFQRALKGNQPQEKTDRQLTLLGIQNRDHVRELTQKSSKDDSFENRGKEIMESVHGAACGFSPSANRMEYLTYASSKPIPDTGFLASLPGQCLAQNRDDLLRFFRENYGHLIMSVISRFSGDDDTLENRGIIKNPIFMLEGSFREIAIPVIHGFSALIAANEFGRTKFLVRALAEMHNMMKAALPASEFIRPVDEQNFFHKDNYLLVKLEGLQQKFIARTASPTASSDPELVVREKKNQQ
jgi:hypothetical protein